MQGEVGKELLPRVHPPLFCTVLHTEGTGVGSESREKVLSWSSASCTHRSTWESSADCTEENLPESTQALYLLTTAAPEGTGLGAAGTSRCRDWDRWWRNRSAALCCVLPGWSFLEGIGAQSPWARHLYRQKGISTLLALTQPSPHELGHSYTG